MALDDHDLAWNMRETGFEAENMKQIIRIAGARQAASILLADYTEHQTQDQVLIVNRTNGRQALAKSQQDSLALRTNQAGRLQAVRLIESKAVVDLSSATEATRLAEVANKTARCNLMLQLTASNNIAPGPIAAAGPSNGMALPAFAAAPVMANAQQVGAKRKAVEAPDGGRV